MTAQTEDVTVVAAKDELRALAANRGLGQAPRIAVDLEASGMFAYRASVCTLQLAWEGPSGLRIAIVDAQAAPIAHLRTLLGEEGPIKIVHDVAFDARLLAEAGIELANVHDTALAAHMLGRTATGLGALLDSELGVHIEKHLQQHDWRTRPLDTHMLSYLASDVAYLPALERMLWANVVEYGIEREVLEETRYRLACAVEAVKTPKSEPAYVRVRGFVHLAEREMAVLRCVAELRESEALRRDVPPHKVAPNEALLTLARSRPTTVEDLVRVRGISTSTPEARAFAKALATAIAAAGDSLPPDEKARLERPRTPPASARARRERETRLIAWRRTEATRRAVDEQVVLPGHCLKDAAEAEEPSVETLRMVRGIGAFRIEQDGAAIVGALRGDGGNG